MRKNYWAKFEQENCYHIYNRCIDGLLLFKTPENYHFLLQKWEQYLGAYCSLYAYCLIPNHFHFLIKCKTPNEQIIEAIKQEESNKARLYIKKEISLNTFLESQFKRFFNSYVASFNKENERRGSLLKAKFKRILIHDPAHFAHLLCYIHHNPIHHKMETTYDNWAHSSFNHYLKIIEPDHKLSPNSSKARIASRTVFELFANIQDVKGRFNFLQAHQDFLVNYREESVIDAAYLGDE